MIKQYHYDKKMTTYVLYIDIYGQSVNKIMLRTDIIIHVTTFLSYTNAFDLRLVNKKMNTMIKDCPKCIKRQIRLHKKIIDGCVYHSNKRQRSMNQPLRFVEDYLHLDKKILHNLRFYEIEQVENSQKNIERLTKVLKC